MASDKDLWEEADPAFGWKHCFWHWGSVCVCVCGVLFIVREWLRNACDWLTTCWRPDFWFILIGVPPCIHVCCVFKCFRWRLQTKTEMFSHHVLPHMPDCSSRFLLCYCVHIYRYSCNAQIELWHILSNFTHMRQSPRQRAVCRLCVESAQGFDWWELQCKLGLPCFAFACFVYAGGALAKKSCCTIPPQSPVQAGVVQLGLRVQSCQQQWPSLFQPSIPSEVENKP